MFHRKPVQVLYSTPFNFARLMYASIISIYDSLFLSPLNRYIIFRGFTATAEELYLRSINLCNIFPQDIQIIKNKCILGKQLQQKFENEIRKMERVLFHESHKRFMFLHNPQDQKCCTIISTYSVYCTVCTHSICNCVCKIQVMDIQFFEKAIILHYNLLVSYNIYQERLGYIENSIIIHLYYIIYYLNKFRFLFLDFEIEWKVTMHFTINFFFLNTYTFWDKKSSFF